MIKCLIESYYVPYFLHQLSTYEIEVVNQRETDYFVNVSVDEFNEVDYFLIVSSEFSAAEVRYLSFEKYISAELISN